MLLKLSKRVQNYESGYSQHLKRIPHQKVHILKLRNSKGLYHTWPLHVVSNEQTNKRCTLRALSRQNNLHVEVSGFLAVHRIR